MCSDAANMTRTKKSTILTEGGQLHQGLASLFINRFASGIVRRNRTNLPYNIFWGTERFDARWRCKMEKTAKIGTFSGWSWGRAPHVAPNWPRFFLTSQPTRGMVPRRNYSSCEKIRRQNIFWGSPNFGGHSHPPIFFFRQIFSSAVLYSAICDLSSNFNSIAQKLAEILIF